MELGDKGQWHKDFNGGFVPILETTEGVMVNESGPLAQFACDFAGPNQGLKLWPHEKVAPGDVNAGVGTVQHKL